jgi:hypothetical protein
MIDLNAERGFLWRCEGGKREGGVRKKRREGRRHVCVGDRRGAEGAIHKK